MIKLFKKKNKGTSDEIIDFEIFEGKVSCIRNYYRYQTRSESTIKMIMDAFKTVSISFTGTFRVYTGDFPKEYAQLPSFYYSCDSIDTIDQALPDFVFDAWPQAGIPDYRTVTEKIAQYGDLPFENSKLLWIGNSKTHPNREVFFNIASEYSNLIDAFDTCVDQFIIEQKEVKYISLEDHTKYKYLIDLEGRGYSGRLKLLLFSKRVLFIQDRPWKEYYHFDLKPYVHYIPVKRDLSDLIEQINFVEAQGQEYYQQIARNAYLYAATHLTYDQAISRISKLLTKTLSPK